MSGDDADVAALVRHMFGCLIMMGVVVHHLGALLDLRWAHMWGAPFSLFLPLARYVSWGLLGVVYTSLGAFIGLVGFTFRVVGCSGGLVLLATMFLGCF